MTVTITGTNKMLGTTDRLENVNLEDVTISDIHKRNGMEIKSVRIARGKRDILFQSSYYHIITVQEETTGRFLMKFER